jgi:hypothetical protein
VDIRIAMTETGAHGGAVVSAYPADAKYVEERKRIECSTGADGSVPCPCHLVDTTTAELDRLGVPYVLQGGDQQPQAMALVDDGAGGLAVVDDPAQYDAVRKIRSTPDTRATNKSEWEAWGRAAGFDVPDMTKGDLVASLKSQAGKWGAP